jgi:photosystem II stability/assembly factor-like uncharacterized protein
MTTISRLTFATCIFMLSACSGQSAPPTAQKQPQSAATSASTQPAYPRCPSPAHCVDLSDGLNPYDFSVKDYKATKLPLQGAGHEATALQLPGADAFLTDFAVYPSGRLLAIGGPGLQVATSSNGGDDWHVITHTQFANALRGISLVNAQRAFAVGDEAGILRTQDAGEHWEAFNVTAPNYDKKTHSDLLFGGDDRGTAYSVAFADADHGVIVGQAGIRDTTEAGLLRTSDGGQQWERIELASPLEGIALQQVAFTDAHNGWAVGSSGTVLRTDDAGTHWSTVPLGDTETHLMGLSFSGPDHGCVAGAYKVWCTWDGGKQWQPVDLALPKGSDEDERIGVTRLQLSDADHGWLITRNGLVYTTTDGGHHWQLWMNVVEASHGKLNGVELWGLTLGHGRAWVVGVGSSAAPQEGSASLNSSPLIVSWSLSQ